MRDGDYLEDLGVLKRVFEKWDGAWTTLIWLRIRTGGALI
jgi:hypothetical protein